MTKYEVLRPRSAGSFAVVADNFDIDPSGALIFSADESLVVLAPGSWLAVLSGSDDMVVDQ